MTHNRKVYLGLWFQRDESITSWWEGMAAGGNGGSRKRQELISRTANTELNKLEMMGAIKFSKPSSDMLLLTRPHILSYSKWPLTEDQIVQNT